MKKRKICELLSIEYPIIQGAMRFISMSEMAAAVSKAGGLGTLAGSSITEIENFMETQSAPATSPEVVKGIMSAGQIAGLIKEIKSIDQVIKDIIAEAESILGKLAQLRE